MSASSVRCVGKHGRRKRRDACGQMPEKDTEFHAGGARPARQQQGQFRHDGCVQNPGREGRGNWWSKSRDHDHLRIHELSQKKIVSCSLSGFRAEKRMDCRSTTRGLGEAEG